MYIPYLFVSMIPVEINKQYQGIYCYIYPYCTEIYVQKRKIQTVAFDLRGIMFTEIEDSLIYVLDQNIRKLTLSM